MSYDNEQFCPSAQGVRQAESEYVPASEFPGWDDGTDWEAEARAASGVDEPSWTGPDVPGPADLGAC